MTRYLVTYREQRTLTYAVDADTKEDADDMAGKLYDDGRTPVENGDWEYVDHWTEEQKQEPEHPGGGDRPMMPRRVTRWRTEDGVLRTSLPQRHRHHSPEGFEVGYGGSGPADFALNILALALPIGWGPTATLWDGTRVSARAYDLHQPFKWALLATANPDQGSLTREEVLAWIARQPTPEGATR